jgi:hypothetical protein
MEVHHNDLKRLLNQTPGAWSFSMSPELIEILLFSISVPGQVARESAPAR